MKSIEIGNMEHLFCNCSNVSPRPHLKRSQDQIQHEDEVENQLDWIAHPWELEVSAASFKWKKQGHPILGVNVALPAHLARNDPTKNGWHKLWFYETAV